MVLWYLTQDVTVSIIFLLIVFVTEFSKFSENI